MTTSAPLTERIAAFALELTLADVPPAEVHQATRLLADTLACGLAARGHELAEALTAYARHRSSAERSTATLLTGDGRADVAPITARLS